MEGRHPRSAPTAAAEPAHDRRAGVESSRRTALLPPLCRCRAGMAGPGAGHGADAPCAWPLRRGDMPAYLEASSPRNRALYERHGFPGDRAVLARARFAAPVADVRNSDG